MDRRSLRELELLDVVDLCGVDAGVQEIADEKRSTPPWLVLGRIEPESDAAKLLDSMMSAIGLKPGKDYTVASTIDDGAVGIQMILALDKASAGQARSLDGPAVVRTLHPDELLANPMDKAKAWEDLLLARRTQAGPA